MTAIPLRLAHSPDPDDAFMWWPLWGVRGEGPCIDTGRFRFEPVSLDIEALNRRSEDGDLEITAMSCAQYPRVADRYAITACGASLGDAYGPKLVARAPLDAAGVRDVTIAVPGERTSAFGALSLMLGAGSFAWEAVPFDTIIEAVAGGAVGAGVVIHEGQLTFADAGLHLVADLGAWWSEAYGLPLPLGLNTVRRDLEETGGPGTLEEITDVLSRSVEHALGHRAEGIAYALDFARGMEAGAADRFVEMYVNRWTLDFGADGRRAVRVFVGALADAGLVPPLTGIEFVGRAEPRGTA